MKFRKQKNEKTGVGSTLDLTPIVDVVFNLLIFFALSLNFAATSGGINVKLPSASSAEPVKSEQLTINLTQAGQVYYNDKEINIDDLPSKLKDIEDKDSLIIIRADNSVPHGQVVEIMDIVKTGGFSKLAIAVDQAKGSLDGKDK
ncbi:MAG: biopolymer transporter ExbD [Thermodesulfobacteriales bacterium]|jgi:biopolymer transport protein ExbD|nr:MAG: biopolymer transporter ExbD [Thermodesulfobacteriales bacterium]